MNMSREKAKEIIWKIFDFIDGTEEYDEYNDCILGHPAFYFFHSKEELIEKVDDFLDTKESFDKYDLYYFINKMIKFLLKSYDSHTKLYMPKSEWLPIQFMFIDGKIFVIRITKEMEDAKFGELIAINGVSIDKFIKDLDDITCYSTKEYSQYIIQTSLNTPNVLRSLTCFDKSSSVVTYTVLKDSIKEDFAFNLEHIKD